MASSNLENLYKQVIMDHYKSPRNKGLPEETDTAYHRVHLKNPSCGDDITIAVKRAGDTLEDIKHAGIGCSICCSSASVMSELLQGKTVEEATKLIENFYQIVKGEDLDETLDMEDAIAYSGVASFPARIKCATISWKAVETAIEETNES